MIAEATMRSEAEIIERIWSRLPTGTSAGTRAWLRIGVGDDAAVLTEKPSRGLKSKGASGEWVLSCDAFLEDRHFLMSVHSPAAVGYKALARATSDLAAMGAAPRFFMLSLALPASRTGKWLDGFLAGMAKAARRYGMILIGGDTSQSATIVMNLTVGGAAAARPRSNTFRSASGRRHLCDRQTRSGATRTRTRVARLAPQAPVEAFPRATSVSANPDRAGSLACR